MLALGNPGPTSGKLTRYRATPTLLEIAAAHGITPANVLEHFRFEFEMPSAFRVDPAHPALQIHAEHTEGRQASQ